MKTCNPGLIDLAATIPTRLSEQLRAVAEYAARQASDPFNELDNNPFIAREWVAVSIEFHNVAASLDQRLAALFNEPILGRRRDNFEDAEKPPAPDLLGLADWLKEGQSLDRLDDFDYRDTAQMLKAWNGLAKSTR